MNLDLVKPDFDGHEYRLISLENGMEVLLISDVKDLVVLADDENMSISDSESEMEDNEMEENDSDSGGSDVEPGKKGSKVKLSACCLCVEAGSFYDPPNAQGLAHFLEHMLFMGNEKYPGDNNWDRYIQTCGGFSNASTAFELTRYHFECREKHLYSVMSRFCEFFISPLMLQNSMAREREAVNSEFEMCVAGDDVRMDELISSFAPEGHPARNFSWGNRESLEGHMSDEEMSATLRDFWMRYYSADRMKVTLVSRLSLDVLESYVREHFSNIPRRTLPRLDLSPFRENKWSPTFNSIVYMKPINEIFKLHLSWLLPPLYEVYDAAPYLYVDFFLENEGKGSILSYLKEKVWALELTTIDAEHSFETNKLFSMYSMSVQLTAEGLKHWKEIIEIIFGYLALLRRVLPDQRSFDEVLAIQRNSFRNKSEVDPSELSEILSISMHFNKPQHYISAGEFCHEYNPEIIKSFINHLGVDNVNILLCDSSIDDGFYDQEQHPCKIKYKVEEIGQERKDSWANAEPLPYFILPEPNPYLTNNFDILPCETTTPYPVKVMETPFLELWFRQDTKFKRPIGTISIYMTSICTKTLRNKGIMDLFAKFITVKLSSQYYNASLADYNWELSTTDMGMHFRFNGYTEKLPLFFTQVVNSFKTAMRTLPDSKDEVLFHATKEELQRSYMNALRKNDKFIASLRISCLEEFYWTYDEKYNVLSTTSFADLATFAREFFSNFHSRILIQGNILLETAKQLILDFSSGFDLPKDPLPKPRIWKMDPGSETILRVYSINPENTQGSVVNYYQWGPFHPRTLCLIQLLTYCITEPLFDSLRTKQQLGYDVYCDPVESYDTLGFYVHVSHQKKYGADDVDERIEEFLSDFLVKLRKFSEKKFQHHVDALLAMKNVEDNTLHDEVARNYSEIIGRRYSFDRLTIESEHLMTLTLNELCDFYYDLLVNLKTKKKLSVQVLPYKDHETAVSQLTSLNKEQVEVVIECPDTNRFITNIDEFRQKREFDEAD